ncbi:MAG: DUF899 domain-containing protein [Spongiibacteraceae bacterium]|nr:DUF899 domain-containing protein [Spongiibacteraceae bacterium]
MNIVSREQWLKARKALLEGEKALTRARDQLSRKRRALPYVKIDTHYQFTSEQGDRSLLDLFAEKKQLIIYHFMYGLDYQQGCKSCSFWADQFDAAILHLEQRDIAFKVISKATINTIQAFRKRMGWKFDWLSANECTFNEDFHVSLTADNTSNYYNYRKTSAKGEMPGISVFLRADDNSIYHTHSCYARGLDIFNSVYHFLDIVPYGRNEDTLPYPMEWVKLHDMYPH